MLYPKASNQLDDQLLIINIYIYIYKLPEMYTFFGEKTELELLYNSDNVSVTKLKFTA